MGSIGALGSMCVLRYGGLAGVSSVAAGRWHVNVPLKCWSSLISRRARLARIFLLKTLVTFLMATPSPVWLLVAALGAESALVMRRAVARVVPDNAVGTLSQLLGYIVALVDDELLVEHLQAVSTRARP